MYSNPHSIPDNILNYIYFNNDCYLEELKRNILRSAETPLLDIMNWITRLEKENLIMRKGELFNLTQEGKNAIENFNSYDSYLS